MSISQQDGVRLRATVSEFGPVLLSRILDLNDTQEGVLSVIFKYCDDNGLLLLDLKDLLTKQQGKSGRMTRERKPRDFLPGNPLEEGQKHLRTRW